ncbi:MAG TPA: hypothetical protein VFO10_21710 [Oligoflexus sp.]|uniref:hypothetical protein n=1 Tax=Oligoflexus sp. TaxID=1971216 RepID=UPI002D7E5603|nr:hypothetical protein [Oligoflexus sp.]HET9239893.1 hypothetical protein [Oligoflexus sp.]
MLKPLIMLAALGLTPIANARAYSINCGSPQGFQSFGRDVTVKAQGVWESLGYGHTRLNYTLQLAVDCVAGASCWASAKGSGKGVVANQDYEPVRYQDFQQFSLDPIPALEQGYMLLPAAVPETASSFRAYAMLDAVRGSFGATVPLLCRGEPVPSSSSSVSESAVAEIARADRIIQDDFGFPGLHLLANAEALEKQMKNGKADKVSVSQATQLAMAVIFDNFDAIEAPLTIAAHGWASTQGERLSDSLTRDQETAARQFLREQMQNPGTSLALHLGGIIKGQDYPPEQGESTQDNWIFVLHIPTLSDHLYWVIVDRRGSKAPYLYGFN